jgi:predicted ATPase/DNA-binding CsgD family transcriptional regulator
VSTQMARAGISAREAEILTLVAEHRSNAEIGAQLFISVRTVETHVSSLLRKLGAPDRRALADLAAELAWAERTSQALAGLPSPLSPFIGRTRERAELRDAVGAHREVTAVGPGGVGKTRLALAVAADLAGDFADGVWFVDLVPVTDPAMVGSAVAAALGLGEQQGRSIEDSVVAALADRRALLVLDNCEHLSAGAAPFVERLLARCPHVRVLTTSRARLVVPFERVYSVPPLSLEGHDGADAHSDLGPSDAVALFVDRATAVGWTVEAEHLDQVADVCRKLDGVALAIELAAARLPALGLDGLVAGLSDHLRLLVGGHRADDRHRSVRAMLDWSEALLSGPDLTLLRRVSVFVSPFTATAAAEVAGFTPLEPAEVVDGLAQLADQSLLTVAASASGTRYRALETIRQYGIEQLTEAGELDATRAQHLRWCLATTRELAEDPSPDTGDWRARFDAAADDLRAALSWAADQPGHHTDARDRPFRWRTWPSPATWSASPSSATSRRPPSPTTPPARLPPCGVLRAWPRAECAATTPTASGRPPRTSPTAPETPLRQPETWPRQPPPTSGRPEPSLSCPHATSRPRCSPERARWPAMTPQPRPL